MKLRRNILFLLFFLVPLALGHACASGEANVPGAGFGFGCGSDDDCPTGLDCSAAAGQCVAPDGLAWSGVLRVIPPESGFDSLEEHFADTSFDTSGSLNIELDRPITVTGRVYASNNVLLTLSNAQVIVVPMSGVQGLARQMEAGTISLSMADGGGSGAGFEFKALRNHVYDLYIHVPDLNNTQLPPYHIRRSFAPSTHSPSPYLLDWDIKIPAQEDYVAISGRLVSTAQGDSPVRGCKVFGWSATAGNVTSSAVTDDGGRFTILAQPSSPDTGESYELWSRPTAENEAVPEGRIAEFDVTSAMDLGDVVVSVGMHPVNVMVDVESSNLALDGLVGSRVTLSGAAETGTIYVERFIAESSRAVFQVPEGDYLLTFITPPDSPWRTTQTAIAISAAPDVQTVSVGLEPKIPVSGTVVSFVGWPVAGARVQAILLPEPETGAAPVESRTSDTITDKHGNWSMDMDVGEYIFVVDPPEGSGLPKGIRTSVFVPAEAAIDMTLTPAIAITGTIKASRISAGSGNVAAVHEPVAAEGIRVEFFWNQWPETIQPVPLAHAITDSKGMYRLLLPAE